MYTEPTSNALIVHVNSFPLLFLFCLQNCRSVPPLNLCPQHCHDRILVHFLPYLHTFFLTLATPICIRPPHLFCIHYHQLPLDIPLPCLPSYTSTNPFRYFHSSNYNFLTVTFLSLLKIDLLFLFMSTVTLAQCIAVSFSIFLLLRFSMLFNLLLMV